MQFTKAASLFTLFFLTLVGLVAAGPVKRDVDSSALDVLNTLKSDVASPLSNIATIGQNSSATTEDYAPYMQQLNDALNTASSSLSAIKSTRAVVERQSDSDVANLVAGIVTDIAQTLDGVLDTSVLASLLPGLDTALDAVLSGLETLLAGVLNLVATLLVDVAGLLRNLALGLTLGSLGL